MIGRRIRTAGSVIAAGLWLATANPAHAQVGAFIDSLFGHKEEPAPQPEAAPAAPAPAKKPAPKAKEASKEAKPGSAKSGKGGDKASDKADHKAPEPKVAAVGAPAAIVTGDSADPATLLAQARPWRWSPTGPRWRCATASSTPRTSTSSPRRR